VIRGYSDHAANERTFLAWVRTGIAVVVFGFVIEKFNLFLLAMATASAVDDGRRMMLERLSGPVGRYEGFALIVIGLALIVVAAIRFIRVRRLIADQDAHDPDSYGAELGLSAVLVVAIAAYSAYLLLG
jgi:putative membrane protein